MVGTNVVKTDFSSAILILKTTEFFIFVLSREFCETGHVISLCVLVMVELAMLVKQSSLQFSDVL